MQNCPYDGTQLRFHRIDPTGRFSPIYEKPEPNWKFAAVGILFGVVIAVMLYLGFRYGG